MAARVDDSVVRIRERECYTIQLPVFDVNRIKTKRVCIKAQIVYRRLADYDASYDVRPSIAGHDLGGVCEATSQKELVIRLNVHRIDSYYWIARASS